MCCLPSAVYIQKLVHHLTSKLSLLTSKRANHRDGNANAQEPNHMEVQIKPCTFSNQWLQLGMLCDQHTNLPQSGRYGHQLPGVLYQTAENTKHMVTMTKDKNCERVCMQEPWVSLSYIAYQDHATLLLCPCK